MKNNGMIASYRQLFDMSPTVSICDAISDPACLERCNCTRSKSPLPAIDLTGDSEESDNSHMPAGNNVCLA